MPSESVSRRLLSRLLFWKEQVNHQAASSFFSWPQAMISHQGRRRRVQTLPLPSYPKTSPNVATAPKEEAKNLPFPLQCLPIPGLIGANERRRKSTSMFGAQTLPWKGMKHSPNNCCWHVRTCKICKQPEVTACFYKEKESNATIFPAFFGQEKYCTRQGQTVAEKTCECKWVVSPLFFGMHCPSSSIPSRKKKKEKWALGKFGHYPSC